MLLLDGSARRSGAALEDALCPGVEVVPSSGAAAPSYRQRQRGRESAERRRLRHERAEVERCAGRGRFDLPAEAARQQVEVGEVYLPVLVEVAGLPGAVGLPEVGGEDVEVAEVDVAVEVRVAEVRDVDRALHAEVELAEVVVRQPGAGRVEVEVEELPLPEHARVPRRRTRGGVREQAVEVP